MLAGQGLVYNPGEWVLGTTTPLYAMMMAGLGSLTGGVSAPFPYLAWLLNALAAYKRFRLPVMIVDAGTATTIDVVDQYGRFLGGAIMPGPRTSLDAMHKGTAALPRVALNEATAKINGPRGLPEIAKNTKDAMIAGVCWSLVGAIEMLKAVYEKQVGPLKVVGTGGAINFVPRTLDIFDAILPHLTLEGIALTIS